MEPVVAELAADVVVVVDAVVELLGVEVELLDEAEAQAV